MTRVYPTIALEAELSTGVWTNIYTDVRRSQQIRVQYGIWVGNKPTDRVAGSGHMKFALNNGENNSGGLLGYYTPGHANARSGWEIGVAVRLKITHGGTDYYKFYGKVKKVIPIAGKYLERSVLVEAYDWMRDAARAKVDLLSLQTDRRSDLVIDDIVSSMTVQPNSTSYQQGQSTFAFALDGLKDEKSTVLAAIQRATLSEFGYSYVVGDTTGGGKLVFEDRHHRVTQSTVEATLTEDELASFDTERDEEMIFNVVRANAYPRDVGTTNEVLWNLQTEINIGASDTEIVIGRYRDPNQIAQRISGKDMVTPVADTDYKFGSSQGGGANDMNANLTVTATFGVNSVKLELTNNAANSGWLNLMQVRGKAVRIFEPAVALAENSTSKVDYGDRPLEMQLLYQDDPLEAQDFADTVLSVFKDPATKIKSAGFWANQGDTQMVDALETEPGTRTQISESMSAIDDEYFVDGVKLVVQDKQLLFCEWALRLAGENNFWLLGETGASELGQTTNLGF